MQTQQQAAKQHNSNAKNESGINQTILGISMKWYPFPDDNELRYGRTIRTTQWVAVVQCT